LLFYGELGFRFHNNAVFFGVSTYKGIVLW
jgi:hypothetical protein